MIGGIGIGAIFLIVAIFLIAQKQNSIPSQIQEIQPKAPTTTPQKIEVPVVDSGSQTHSPTHTQPPSSSSSSSQSSSKYSCDYLTGQCVSDPSGTLSSCDECEKETYYCDSATWTCRDVGFRRDSKSQCKRNCFPDLRIKGNYTAQQSDTNANGEGAFCDQGRYRKALETTLPGTNVLGYEWEDMECAGFRCCTSHYCDPSGVGEDVYSETMCPSYSTEELCNTASSKEVPAYCEWDGSACVASQGETSACAACTSDSDCPGLFGAFKCESGNCVVQGTPKCDVIHKEFKTDEVIPDHMHQACTQLFDKDKDTIQRLCKDISDGNTCTGSYFERDCVDRYGKVWLTERSHCGPRSAPVYPSVPAS